MQYFKVVEDDGFYWVIVRVKSEGEWNSVNGNVANGNTGMQKLPITTKGAMIILHFHLQPPLTTEQQEFLLSLLSKCLTSTVG